MRSVAALACLWLVASVASAQHGEELLPYEPSSLDYPDRAAALRPSGMAEMSLTWSRGTAYLPPEREEDVFFQSADVRVPYESAIFEASWAGALEHYDPTEGGPFSRTALVYRVGNPRLGASWREQADGWRLELGGALNLAWLHTEALDSLEAHDGSASIRFVPNPTSFARYRGSWNSFLLAERLFALIAHGRFELDLAPEVVVGAELDVPLVADLHQSHFYLVPQLAIEAAWRFLAHSMLGVRAQLVVLAISTHSYGVATSLEPFLRIGYAHGHVGWFAVLAAEIYLGPDAYYAPVDPRGSVAPKIGCGILF